jgi:Domain of unknown function (DUF4276)
VADGVSAWGVVGTRGDWRKPMMDQSLVIVVEGGASSALSRRCRKAFVTLIERSGAADTSFDVLASGSRSSAVKVFARLRAEGRRTILLVDAESEIAERYEPPTAFRPWSFLTELPDNHVTKPSGADDSSCHLMVQFMESWIVCDPAAISAYYGIALASGLPAHRDIERVSKADVLTSLKRVSRSSGKGEYRKASHSFELLRCVDPDRVSSRSRWAKRFFDHIQELTRT